MLVLAIIVPEQLVWLYTAVMVSLGDTAMMPSLIVTAAPLAEEGIAPTNTPVEGPVSVSCTSSLSPLLVVSVTTTVIVHQGIDVRIVAGHAQEDRLLGRVSRARG